MSKYVEDWSKYPNFRKEEFRCKCGKCDGYGNGIATTLVETMQNLRTKYGKAINISSGYRCKEHNQVVGGSSTSKHMQGLACDFYFQDGSLASQDLRMKIVNELKQTPYYHYSYCNYDGSHPNMGSAIHIDTLLVDVNNETIVNDNDNNNITIGDTIIDNSINIGDTIIDSGDNQDENDKANSDNIDEKDIDEKLKFWKKVGIYLIKILKKVISFFLKG